MTKIINTKEIISNSTKVAQDSSKNYKWSLSLYVVQNLPLTKNDEYFIVVLNGMYLTRLSFRNCEYVKINEYPYLEHEDFSSENSKPFEIIDMQFVELPYKERKHLLEIIKRNNTWKRLIKAYNKLNHSDLPLYLKIPNYKLLTHNTIDNNDLLNITGFSTTILSSKETDLKFNIIACSKFEALKRDLPRLFFQNDYEQKISSNFVVISLSKTPTILTKNYILNINEKDLEQLKIWIINNYQVLIDYWDLKISSLTLINEITKEYV